MKPKHLGLKILFTIVLGFVIFFAMIALLLASAFSAGSRFYTPLIIMVSGGIMIFVILRLLTLIKPKILYLSLLGFLAIAALAFTGYEIYMGYIHSFPSVSEQEVDLREYAPFASDTKAVRLPEPASFKITDNLPKLDGATALYPLYAAFVQAVYPEKKYNLYSGEVACNTTIQAYEHLIAGKVDLIFAARPSQQQLDAAAAQGVTLKLTPIGREAFVFFVNSQNPVTGLTTAEIQGIYSGRITNWRELGGKNQTIRPFQRPENSGSQTLLQKLMAGKKLILPPKEDVVGGMGGIIERAANYRNFPNAIGYSFLFFATEMVHNDQIHLLKVDGVYPDRDTIRDQTYPLTTDFYAVTAGSSNIHLQALIDWILSRQGQSLVEKTGYTPIRGE